MKVKCVIIDDEPLALKLMEDFAGKVPFLEIKKTFSSPTGARDYIESESVDLVFLDINMPDISGIDLLKTMNKKVMSVFCTAYPDFALEGFELQVIDYLIKPFSFERFLKSVCRAQELLILKNLYGKEQKEINDHSEFIFVKSEYSLVKINVAEIILLEGLKDYIKIYLTSRDKPVLTLQSLKALEEKLPARIFCRVHKSFVVNMSHIKSVQRNHVMIGEREIPVGNQYRDSFLSIITGRMPG